MHSQKTLIGWHLWRRGALSCAGMLLLGATAVNPVRAQAVSASSSIQKMDAQVAAQNAKIHIRPSMKKCIDDANAVTYVDRSCIRTEYSYQDHRLNSAYKALTAKVNSGGRLQLRDEERSWIKSRDSECAPRDGGGQSDELDGDECLVTETARRATELESRLDVKN